MSEKSAEVLKPLEILKSSLLLSLVDCSVSGISFVITSHGVSIFFSEWDSLKSMDCLESMDCLDLMVQEGVKIYQRSSVALMQLLIFSVEVVDFEEWCSKIVFRPVYCLGFHDPTTFLSSH